MKKILSGGKKVLDILGTVMPALAFSLIFLTFMVTIVSRYVLKAPVAWTYEVSILAYMWTMFFGVGKAMEADEHVVFGLVYDHVGPRAKLALRMAVNVVLVVLVSIVFFPSIRSLESKRMVTGVLKLPFSVVFAPMIYMFAEIIVRSLIDLWRNAKDLASLLRGEGGAQ